MSARFRGVELLTLTKITVIKKFDFKTELKRTATSILDLTDTRSIDLSSEMETEARNEQERSNSSNWNASAGFSFMGFGASGGGGGASNQTSKQFARDLHKIAQKAASSITRKSRQEVTTSISTQTNVENAETTEISVKNINEGRTLNLLFFQVNNRYEGGVYLDDLKLTIAECVELIAGTGITSTRTFQLRDLVEAFRYLKGQTLPLGLGNTPEYRNLVITVLLKTFKEEYLLQSEAEEDAYSSNVLRFSGPVPSPPANIDDETELRTIANALANSTIVDQPIVAEQLVIPSNATYLDTLIGLLPGTEPYSEEMRKQEVRMRAAQVYKEASSGYYDEAKGRALMNLPGVQIPLSPHSGSENYIVGPPSTISGRRIKFFLHRPLDSGDWHILYNGESKHRLSIDAAGRSAVVAEFDTLQAWLSDTDLEFKIRLWNAITDENILVRIGA